MHACICDDTAIWMDSCNCGTSTRFLHEMYTTCIAGITPTPWGRSGSGRWTSRMLLLTALWKITTTWLRHSRVSQGWFQNGSKKDSISSNVRFGQCLAQNQDSKTFVELLWMKYGKSLSFAWLNVYGIISAKGSSVVHLALNWSHRILTFVP